MAINSYNIKKWYHMLAGNSVLHVNQDMGKAFIPGEMKGYFNNLTEKVTKEPALLENDQLPIVITSNGENITFPVAIFQYGLGAYDLYLQTHNTKYFEKFRQCVNWAIDNIEQSGAWDNFSFIYPDHPYGAMCQGEGVSLLLRAYTAFSDTRYLAFAKRAANFMLLSVEQGGTAKYDGDELYLLEYTHLPVVLNGWVFALFGLYDMTLLSNDKTYSQALEKTLNTLEICMPKFDNGYWSMYEIGKKLASPFYHNLHIAQMRALYIITGDETFKNYQLRFEGYCAKRRSRVCAFIMKSIQKVLE